MRDIILNFDAARGEFEMFRQIPHQGKQNARHENDRRKNGSASIQVSSNPFNHFFFFFFFPFFSTDSSYSWQLHQPI